MPAHDLRDASGPTGQVPARKKVIEEWATGSTRADRLRGIVLNEAASKGSPSDCEVTGHPPGPHPIRLGPPDTTDET